MNKLESKFKQALENHEMDYDPKAWDSFKRKLDGQQPVPNGGSKTLAKLGIAATVVTSLSVGAYFLMNGNGSNEDLQKAKTDEVNVIEDTPNKNLVEVDAPAHNDEERSHIPILDDNGADAEVNHQVDVVENNLYHLDRNENNDEVINESLNLNQGKIKNDVNQKNEEVVHHNTDKVNEKVVLNASFTVSTVSGCEGLVCQFTPKQSMSFKGDYVWDFGDGAFSKERNPKHEYKKSGNFVVKLTLRSENNNEILSDHTQEYVTVYENPKVDFEIKENAANSSIPEFDFINTTDRASQWTWLFGDNTRSSMKAPSHTYRKKGIYNVKLIARNAFGCETEVSKKIIVENDFNLFAPTAFTPDGDGLNEGFVPKALEVMNAEFTMSIFHKNGQLYYETNQVSRPWDGKYMKDNQNAPEGAYIWVVQLKNKNGETEVYKGSVTLLRD